MTSRSPSPSARHRTATYLVAALIASASIVLAWQSPAPAAGPVTCYSSEGATRADGWCSNRGGSSIRFRLRVDCALPSFDKTSGWLTVGKKSSRSTSVTCSLGSRAKDSWIEVRR